MRIRWTAGQDSCTPYGQNCGDTGREAEPGMESPVQVRYQGGRQIPLPMGRHDAERNKVAKPRPLPVEKSRYGSIRARTVNRHRWMRRGS